VEWHIALKEMNRVLKYGGVLLVHEPRKKALDNLERFLKIHHPKESRFEWPELFTGLIESGFHVAARRKLYLGSFQSCLCIKDK
jgi:ubiquinone/menaquinone biosynthesis C-methylase UbiE